MLKCHPTYKDTPHAQYSTLYVLDHHHIDDADTQQHHNNTMVVTTLVLITFLKWGNGKC